MRNAHPDSSVLPHVSVVMATCFISANTYLRSEAAVWEDWEAL